MGKSLKELLNDKEKGLLVPADGLGSTPPPTPPQPDFVKGRFKSLLLRYNSGIQINRINSDIVFLKNFPKVALTQYGLDAPRILTQTDPHKQKKTIKKAADKIGPAIGGKVGAVIGGVASSLASFKPKYPDDFTVGEDGNPTGMESRFYSNGLINGDYARGFYYNPYHNQSKSRVGKFFGAAKTPGQIKDAAIATAKSAAIGLAVAAAGLLIKKVFTKNKKKGKGDEPKGINQKTKPSSGFRHRGKINSPYFPSTLALNSGIKSGVTLGSYSRYSRANFNIGAIDYLNRSEENILKEISPTVKESDFLPGYIDTAQNLNQYYLEIYKQQTPQTRNEGNVIVSAPFINNNYFPTFDISDVDKIKKEGYYTAYKQNNFQGNALDNKIENFSKLVDKEGNAYIVPGERDYKNYFTNNDISKVSSLHQNYGGGETNLLTIALAKNTDDVKIDTLGNPLDPNGNFYAWQSQGATYTKDFLKDKDTSIQGVSGSNYASEVKTDSLRIENGGIGQYFGTKDTNLLKIISSNSGSYIFELRTNDAKNELISYVKGDDVNSGEVYSYSSSEIKINTITTQERSRFFDKGEVNADKSKLYTGYADGAKNVETQLGQQFGDAYIWVDLDTTNKGNYQLPYKKIDGTDYYLKYNTKEEPVSKTVLNITTEEQSRFISGSVSNDSKLKLAYGDKNVETEIGQQFGDSFISVNVDTKDDSKYQFPYKKIDGTDTVARWNTKNAPFSSNLAKIMTDRDSEVAKAIQTQMNAPTQINPYLTIKRDVLESNKEDYLKISIGGINFLSILTSFNDKSTSNWDSVKPVGSGLNFYLFNNWERDITFDLKLYANNKAELTQMWQKVNSVQKLTMGNPSGKSGAAYGVYGNIVLLIIGDLIKEVGFVNDINMTVDDVTVWETDKKSQAPFVCTISVSFKVVTNEEGDKFDFYQIAKA